MQPTTKSTAKPKTKRRIHDETEVLTKKPVEERLKRSTHELSTPRNFAQKSTANIYAENNALSNSRAPKKVVGTSSRTSISPMKELLKSSPSTVSISSRSSYDPGSSRKATSKKLEATAKSTKTRELPFSNVTVNSPVSKRRPNSERAKKSETKQVGAKSFDKGDSKEIVKASSSVPRQRTKTRTLNEDEVKLLKPDVVQNNAELQKLNRKLSAKPEAFYVEFGAAGDQKKKKDANTSEEEVSYEDDFESYESDFESYHSDKTDASEQQSEQQSDAPSEDSATKVDSINEKSKDEERMLDSDTTSPISRLLTAYGYVEVSSNNDTWLRKNNNHSSNVLSMAKLSTESGSFDLRDQRSAASRRVTPLQYIVEGSEPSLPDEGFQDMATSNASSLRHVDVLDRPLFIDFSKSKHNKLKKKTCERLRQRANDLLSMITLHEMSYALFEMKPIPYDLYMATFGRSNYTQIACQTFEDGITEEIQTEEILCDSKWTQHPVEFSKNDVYLNSDLNTRKRTNEEDFLEKFTFLDPKHVNDETVNKINTDKSYKENPLRILFEQKDGVGACKMLPYENYKAKVDNKEFDVGRLRKFLKRVEGKVSNILNINSGGEILTDHVKSTRLTFSRGYVTVTSNKILQNYLPITSSLKITNVLFSETKSNLIMTIHGKSSPNVAVEKCVICLWDISAATLDPLKILVAIDDVVVAKFTGGTDGLFVAALEDGSIHLWDLSEEPKSSGVASDEKKSDWVENSNQKSHSETHTEWILNNSARHQTPLRACAYTSSAANMADGVAAERAAGLQLLGQPRACGGGRKVVGQICSLQRNGLLELWAIVQEKYSITHDSGKAFWSKMKLEPSQKINLINYIDIPTKDLSESDIFSNFNLNAAKRRLSNRRLDKMSLKTRAKSASSSNYESDRPASAVSAKVLPDEKRVTQTWESGVVCYDLKVTQYNKTDNYLVAKNCGEVLWFTRNAGTVKIDRFCVATDTSSVSCLDTSPHGLPYFLAGTDTGTVSLCCLALARVLLTLDCRNLPPSVGVSDVCLSDSKGRYAGSVTVRKADLSGRWNQVRHNSLPVTSIHWSNTNPCCVYTVASNTVVVWDLTTSDITARCVGVNATTATAHTGEVLAILTPEGEVQVHRTASNSRNDRSTQLFLKYVSLL